MVPVIDKNKVPLMPCSEKRARQLMERNYAKPYWQKGVFCIRLIRNPSDRRSQPIVLGLDPGSKREAYTVVTKKKIVLNIITNTPYWVKDKIETRRTLRRNRRYRKTPYRKCRSNRSSLKKNDRISPSTKARWDAKLRVIRFLMQIIPISSINIEDIKARTRKGKEKKQWNQSFSPLEIGKKYFEKEIESLGLELMITSGYITKEHRDKRNFNKSKKKLDYIWESHNVDSHCLAEISLDKEIEPYKGLYRLDFLQFYRRQLHVQNPSRKNIRKTYGSTVSMGMSRGSILKYKDKIYYLGGSSKDKVAIHSITTGKRVKQFVDIGDIKRKYNNNWRVQFLPRLKSLVSLHDFS